MSSNIKLLLTSGAAAFGLAVVPAVAQAQLDHLVCYRPIDKLTVTASFSVYADLQPEFSASNCKIVKVTDFCVPSTKYNVDPTTADVRPDIVGPPLYVDYIGYLIKCEKQLVPPNKIVIDQFGAHRQRKYKVYKIFVPAKKGPPPCGTQDGKLCGGVCPNRAEECRIDTDGVCKCVPPEDDLCSGKPDKQGMCGGPCPLVNQACQPTLTATGDLVCQCGPVTQPCSINAATGACGGDCPNRADKCVNKTPYDCTCEPAETPCALSGTPPTCGGDCPIAGDICTLVGAVCECGPGQSSPCQQNPLTGTCGGDCPIPGDICRADGTINGCSCGPAPCGGTADGQCAGACPGTGQLCRADASGACNCDPPSCAVTGTGTCGGECPAGQTCRVINLSTGITCRCG
jgi:hypothetical protein